MTDAQNPLPPQEDLEREKLHLEIAQLRKPWWRKVGTYATLVPIMIAIVAMIQGLRSGFFDRQAQILELRERQLRIDVSVLERARDSISTLIETARAVRARTRLTTEDLRRTRSSPLERRFASAFPEFGGTWGVTEVYDSANDVTLEYLMIPFTFAESFVIEHDAAQRSREERVSLSLLDSLRRRIIELQDSLFLTTRGVRPNSR